MSELTTLQGRCMYIWKLNPVLIGEMGIDNFCRKAKKAKLSSVWIKVAQGRKRYPNITDDMESRFRELIEKLNQKGIAVWGWHVPKGQTKSIASEEAQLVASIADELNLEGILMDAESEEAFFQGDDETAAIYAKQLKELLMGQGKGLAISSHDIPQNFPDFPFEAFAQQASVNAPQVYYGGSPSVEHRLNRAVRANQHLEIPFVPVGAAWIGDGGGCSSASACAERAKTFMELVREHNFPGYSFWHWAGAPLKFWEALFMSPV
jgi:hypothetical protein